MAIMKNLLNEHYGVEVSQPAEPMSYHQSQCHHHSAKAMECGRASRHHAVMADNASAQNTMTEKPPTDDITGQHLELAQAYGTAAKAHLSLADHHSVQFKKDRTDTVKQSLKPISNPLGKTGVRK